MITKKLQCPECEQIFTLSGEPSDSVTTQCPSCNLTGKVTFDKSVTSDIQSENIAIEVNNLRKEYGDLVAVNNISFSVDVAALIIYPNSGQFFFKAPGFIVFWFYSETTVM